MVGYWNPAPDMIGLVGFERVNAGPDGAGVVQLEVPRPVTEGELASFGLLVRPPAGDGTVRGTAVLTAADGGRTHLQAEAELPASGGLVQFAEWPDRLHAGITEITVTFDSEVDLGYTTTWWGEPNSLHIMWMGQP
jgi:hypothetical protein